MPTLDWIGKAAVVNHHRKVPYRLLKCDRELSAGDADAGNLLVQGDNLLALKALLPYYAGKVKCIYIDPPYNTGNEGWAYNDNVNSPEIRQWIKQVVGREGEDLSRHDKWLCMMYPRLALLRDFLTQDGFIFVSLDDNEIASTKFVFDELFGQRNFVAQIVIEANRRGQTYKEISKNHEYVLCYSRSAKSALRKLDTDGEKLDRNDDWGAYSARELRNRNPKFNRNNRPNLFYPIYIDPHPATPEGHHRILLHRTDNAVETLPLNSSGHESCWRWGNPKLIEEAQKGLQVVYASKTRSGEWRVFEKYRKETITPKSLWTETQFISEQGTSLLRQMGLGERFQFPKPTALIQRVIQIATDKDSLILDSFAGSGTTAHAVLAQNKADGGTRRFITVEMDEAICRDVTSQRIRKAIEGYGEGDKATPGLGGGFRFCKLGAALFDEAGNIGSEVKFSDLAAHVFFTETGSPIPKRADGKTPLLGVHQGKAVYLLFNGVLGDRRPAGGNVLTHEVAGHLPPHPDGHGARVVYGEACRLGPKSLEQYGITFRQIPFELKVD
ncbi:MAG: site-specific DNA-methyltransferase [Phycisphaerales bacterium]|nr:site-specific DNA-methyltransferase [Phycisphaerales bacterium]